jgi:NCS1 nucleoside transporter family
MPSNSNLADDPTTPAALAQPRGVEQHGVDPIPGEERTVGWWNLFQILINVMLNPGMILAPGLAVVSGLSFWAAITADLLGILVAFIAYTIMATVGVDYGLPGIVSTRAFMGTRASQWLVSTVRAVTSAFWFAFQTIAGAMGISAVLKQLFHIDVSLVLVSVLFAILQVVVALVGYGSLTWLSKIAFPAKVLILGYLLYVMISHGAPGHAPADVFSWQGSAGWKWAVFALWAGAMATSWFSQVTDAADYCRYCNSRRDMWIATMAAALLGTFGAAFFGAYAAAASGATLSNAFEYIPGLHVGAFTLVLVLIVLALDNWTINVLNVYTGGLSLANLTVRLGRFWSTMVVAAVGCLLAALPQVVSDFTNLVSTFGSVFGPIVGIIVADYLVVKRGRLDVAALYDAYGPYRYQGGFNLVAVAWVVIGTVVYFLLPGTALPILVTAVGAGLGYLATVRLTRSLGVGTTSRAPVGASVELLADETVPSEG